MIVTFPASLTPDWVDPMQSFTFSDHTYCEFELPEIYVPDGWYQNDCYRRAGHTGRHLVLVAKEGTSAEDTWYVVPRL